MQSSIGHSDVETRYLESISDFPYVPSESSQNREWSEVEKKKRGKEKTGYDTRSLPNVQQLCSVNNFEPMFEE